MNFNICIINYSDIIRQRYTPGTVTETVNIPGIEQRKEIDFYFKNLILDEEKNNPNAQLVFYQKRIRVGRLEKSILKKIFSTLSIKELLETLHLFDGREIKIIRREKPFKNILQPIYGKEDIFIPVDHVKKILTEMWPDTIITRFSIETVGNSIDCYSISDNPALDRYLEILEQILS